MGRMIRDLLEYTRAASMSDTVPGIASLEQVLEGALANLGASIRESSAVVTHDPLPDLRKSLHCRSRYSGSGLAICKKLVERYARIWVESELGKGSIFFTLAESELAQ